MRKVFICSPYRGDIEANTEKAKAAARIAVGCGYIPIVPHLYFPSFLNELDEHERIKGITMGVELMKDVDEIWVVGTTVTEGMEFELDAVKKSHIPVRLQDEEMRGIDPATLRLDRRITEEFRRAVLRAKMEAGKRKEVKALLMKYDSGKLSGVKPEDYAALMAEAEAL